VKKAIFCKYKFSILFDFIILSVIFAIFAFSIFFIRNILFDSTTSARTVIFKTEVIPVEKALPPNEGDILYDPITKRKVGRVKEAYATEYNGGISFIITADITAQPRTDALRTVGLWFRFYEESEA